MYRMNYNDRPNRTWLWVPILIVVAILATNIGLALYLHGLSPTEFGLWFPFPFFPLLFIPIVFLFFFGFRGALWGGWGCGGWYGMPYADPAVEALRERYARGEITNGQFDELRRNLGQ